MKAATRSRFHGAELVKKALAVVSGRASEWPPLERFGRSSSSLLVVVGGGRGERLGALAVADVPARAMGALDVLKRLARCLAVALLALI